MEKVCIFGQMVKDIKDNGKIMKCMVMEFIHGMTEEDIKDIIKTTKNKDLANISMLMEKYIKECGKMVNRMEKENYINKTQ